MKITLEVTVTGLKDWDVDWSDGEGVKMELTNIEEQARFAIVREFGLDRDDVEVEAVFDSGN